MREIEVGVWKRSDKPFLCVHMTPEGARDEAIEYGLLKALPGCEFVSWNTAIGLVDDWEEAFV